MKNENYFPTSPMINIKKTELILRQMKESVCKINAGSSIGTGFFYNLPLENKKYLIILITAFHIIEAMCSNSIQISLNNGEKSYSIKIKNRFIHKDKEHDIVIIEIKPQDKIENYPFEIDYNYKNELKNNSSDIYDEKYKKLIYICQYPEGYESQVSFGIIKNIMIDEQNKYYIRHSSSTTIASSGSPIV